MTMQLITVNMPEHYIEALDSMIGKNVYPNRSEAMRVAVRDLLKREYFWNVKEYTKDT